MYQSYTLSHRDALRIVAAIREVLEQDGKGAAIAVTDAHGELIALLRTDGCPLPSITNAINKAFTAAREQTASGTLGEAARTEAFALTNFGDLRYTGWGGGVPIRYQGRVVGAVGVSGLPEDEDVALAELGARVALQDAGAAS